MSEPIENPTPQPITEDTAGKKEPLETPTEPTKSIEYDKSFVDDLVEKIENKLSKKLYYGRKQEKLDKKDAQKVEINEDESSIGTYIVEIMGAIVIVIGLILAYFGYVNQNAGAKNENNS